MAKIPTVRIHHPDVPTGMVILASDFRDGEHTLFTPTEALAAADMLAAQTDLQARRQARMVELREMRVKEVRAILEARGVFIDKAQAIDAIVTAEFGPAVEPTPIMTAEPGQ